MNNHQIVWIKGGLKLHQTINQSDLPNLSAQTITSKVWMRCGKARVDSNREIEAHRQKEIEPKRSKFLCVWKIAAINQPMKLMAATTKMKNKYILKYNYNLAVFSFSLCIVSCK